jgi:archaellin
MNATGNMAVSTLPVLACVMLVGATTSSTLFTDSGDHLTKDAQQLVNDVLDDLTTYLKIDDVIGKYDQTTGRQRIEKLVLLVKPLFVCTLDIAHMTITLTNDNDVIILIYSNQTVPVSSTSSIFEGTVWETPPNTFSLISIIDTDNSLTDYGIMNDDIAYLTIRIPPGFSFNDDDSLTITLIPPTGITRTILLETPTFHTSSIVSFGAQ